MRTAIDPRVVRLAIRYERVKRQASAPKVDTEYQTRPIDWIVDRLGVSRESLVWSLNPGYDRHAWDGTPDPLARAAEALAGWRNVGVESGTGTGKSYVCACLVLWFLGCWRGARVFTFAPKEDQLRAYMWTEIRKLWPRFEAYWPRAELTDLRIRMIPHSDEWGAIGYPVGVRAGEQVATRAAGMHAEHMLLVYEEMPGQHTAVIAAGEQTCTAPHNLRLGVGNPDNRHDTLHEFCSSPTVEAVRISALDHPNVVTATQVVPGAVGPQSIAERRAKHGEDSPMYQSRVRGISPTESVYALIRSAWCAEAVARYSDRTLRDGVRALGVDVANSEHGDRGAIARGLGACLLEVDSFACPDANELGRQVLVEVQTDGIEGRHVGVDSVGVGAGTVNELRWRGQRIRALNGGESAYQKSDIERWHDAAEDDELPDAVVEEERYGNLRSQMWWQLRLDLQRGRIALPADEELVRDLTTPTFETRGGKVWVESKEAIRDRLGRSPDKGDAAVYWNWVRQRQRKPKFVPTVTEDEHRDTSIEKRIVERLRRKNQRGAGGGRRAPLKGG